MDLKRLWDTENKKIVRAVNKDTNKEYQVWTNDDGSKQTHVCKKKKKKPKNKEVSDSVKNDIKIFNVDAKSVECFSMFYRVSYIFLITFAFILA